MARFLKQKINFKRVNFLTMENKIYQKTQLAAITIHIILWIGDQNKRSRRTGHESTKLKNKPAGRVTMELKRMSD